MAKATAAISPKTERFPCDKCGALLAFEPGTQQLVCQYCGQKNPIEGRFIPMQEYDLHQALHVLGHAKSVTITKIHCDACGANFKFADSLHAGECPFCGSEIVTEISDARPITPRSLLPFKIDKYEAKEQFRQWLKTLWFVPSKVKKFADAEANLQGVYIPYWTFDSQTETVYQGARGRVYHVKEHVQSRKSGGSHWQAREVPRVDWTPVQGKVERHFDDVLVGASKSLPRTILEHLEPWDLENLVPYNEKYLSGFASEFYQVDLDVGFDEAKDKMESVIYQDIAAQIGGDDQRIDRFHTQHHQTTYKHCLLPVWSAAYEYQQKTYRFVVNGRTGKVKGERPYSYWKIAFVVIFGLIVLDAALTFMEVSSESDQEYNFEQEMLEREESSPQ